jgi:DNA-directed RNA polymerase subunit M/transcription elongation factor TFIIS
MPIEFDCPECGKHLAIKAKHQGKLVGCPACGRSVMVPDPFAGKPGATPPAPESGALNWEIDKDEKREGAE